jgi:hypothetical protein
MQEALVANRGCRVNRCDGGLESGTRFSAVMHTGLTFGKKPANER